MRQGQDHSGFGRRSGPGGQTGRRPSCWPGPGSRRRQGPSRRPRSRSHVEKNRTKNRRVRPPARKAYAPEGGRPYVGPTTVSAKGVFSVRHTWVERFNVHGQADFAKVALATTAEKDDASIKKVHRSKFIGSKVVNPEP